MKASIVIAHCVEIIQSRIRRVADGLIFYIGTQIEALYWKVYKVTDFLLLSDLCVG